MAHNDIKLENMVLNDHLKVSLIDFGFSGPLNIRNTTKYGTLYCLPPEVYFMMKGGDYNAEKADIFCLGIAIFVILFQGRPFQNE